MDGLLLPAGMQGTDWTAHWQERESHPGSQTWALSWEIALAQLASFVGMPVLVIADGAEKWNGALGGSRREPLVSSTAEVPTTPETWDRHRIRVRANSTLATVLQPALSSSEGEQKPWGLDHVYATTLFDAFLHACRSFDLTRQQNAAWTSSRDAICATLAQRVEQGDPLLSSPPLLPNEKRQHPSLSKPLTGQQERIRQRSQTPTKEEWNQMRRHRLNASAR